MLALILLISLAWAPSWLDTSDPPTNADALVVLGGDFTRELFAAELWKRGIAREIYVSQMAPKESYVKISKLGVAVPSDNDVSRSILVRSGVPANRVHFFGPSVSTREEAASLRKALRNGTKFLIVTSPYHVTRSRLIFRQEFDQRQFRVVGTTEEFPRAWWTHQGSARNVVLEIIKLIHFELGGAFKTEKTARRF